MLSGKSLGLIGVLALAGAAPRAQPAADGEPLRFARFTSREGLSHNTVLSVLQDSRGFLWIGTADGLNRYDGYTFTVFRHDPADAASLSDNTIQALAEAPDGALWVGTAAGLDRLDPLTGRVERMSPPGLDVNALGFDPEGGLWVSGEGLHRYDPPARSAQATAAGRLLPVRDHPLSGLPGLHHVVFSTSPDGTLWTMEAVEGHPSTLHRFQQGGPGFTAAAGLPPGAQNIHAGRSGTLWVFVPEGAAPASIGLPLRLAPTVPGGAWPGRLLEDRRGRLWIGADDGVYLFDPATGALTRHVLDPAGGAALANYVLALCEDRAGGVWVGTRSGLYRWDPHRKPFRHLAVAPAAPVMALREADDGEAGGLWLGTLGGGLLRLGPEGRVAAHLRAGPGGLPSDHVWALHADPAAPHRLWVGTDEGLAVLDRRTGRVTTHRLAADSLGRFHVYTLAADGAGGLWAGGGQWLYRLDAATGRLRARVALGAVLRSSTVQALHTGRDGVLWIGTEKRGLWAYRAGRLAPAAPGALDGATVWTIHEDDEDRLWLGTTAGLVRLDPVGGTATRFYEPQGPAALVYSILPDDAGRLWVGGGRGLARFDPATGHWRAYDALDGVENGEFNRRAAWRAHDGTLYLGGLDGVTAFHPAAVRDDPTPPPVHLTRVLATSREGTMAHPPGPGPLRLSWRDHTLVFEYVAPGFSSPARNRYAYRLDGLDRDWVQAGADRQARYVDVPPGRYTFRVKAASGDGVWNEAGAALALVVVPPYWQTAWFRLLALALVVALGVAAYRWRVRQLLAVERLRLRIASDLHDDVGSKLGSIALMTEVVAARGTLGARERGQLEEVARVARRMAGDLRDIVWLVRPGTDTLGDLAAKLEHVAAGMLDGVACTVEAPAADAAARLSVEARRHLFLAVREALHNVARHAHAAHVAVRLARVDGGLLLEVRDDGVGFDPAARIDGTGLASLRGRASQLGGAFAVESRPGEGTTLRLVVPLR
jgi:ligand-binding sensor domain-containing protein/signal transduction histidine kinase